jgi:hypothetical protein
MNLCGELSEIHLRQWSAGGWFVSEPRDMGLEDVLGAPGVES